MTETLVETTPSKTSIWSVLRFRNFRFLWIGEGVSLLGDQFYVIALPLLALRMSGGSGVVLGTMLALASIPRAVFMILGGAVSDRYSPRTIMILSNGVRAILTSLLTALLLTGNAQLWHLYVLTFIFGIADAFFYPAYNSMLPRLVDDESLEAGNALLQITLRLSFLIGPGIAGAVVGFLGMGAALAIDTLTFVVSITCLLLIRDQQQAASKDTTSDTDEPGILASVMEGLRYVWRDPLLPLALLMVAIVDFAVGGPLNVGLPVLSEVRFSEGAAGYGLMLSAFGAGSLLGVLISGMIQFSRRGLLFLGLMTLFGLSIGLMAFVPSLLPAALLMGLTGVGSGIFNVVGVSWIQRRTDRAMMGRVMSLISFSSVSMQPISNAIAGLMVDASMNLMFLAAGIFILVGMLSLSFHQGLRQLR